jgi:hypothetical protein
MKYNKTKRPFINHKKTKKIIKKNKKNFFTKRGGERGENINNLETVSNINYKKEFTNSNGELIIYEGKYSGNIFNNQPQNLGVLEFNNGNKYEGMWNNGIPNGKGVLTWGNGDNYNGEFQNGEMTGNGILHFNDNPMYERYEGKWKNGKLNGDCMMVLQNGAIYKGNCINNVRSGYGVFTTPIKEYKGEWLNDKPNGKGEITFFDTNVVLKGKFNMCLIDEVEKICAVGVAYYPDGSKFLGSFQNNEKISGKVLPDEPNNLAGNNNYNMEFGYINDPDSIATDIDFL